MNPIKYPSDYPDFSQPPPTVTYPSLGATQSVYSAYPNAYGSYYYTASQQPALPEYNQGYAQSLPWPTTAAYSTAYSHISMNTREQHGWATDANRKVRYKSRSREKSLSPSSGRRTRKYKLNNRNPSSSSRSSRRDRHHSNTIPRGHRRGSSGRSLSRTGRRSSRRRSQSIVRRSSRRRSRSPARRSSRRVPRSPARRSSKRRSRSHARDVRDDSLDRVSTLSSFSSPLWPGEPLSSPLQERQIDTPEFLINGEVTDVEIVVIDKELIKFAEAIKDQVLNIGLTVAVGILEDGDAEKVVRGAADNGSLFAIVVLPELEAIRAVRLYILHGGESGHKDYALYHAVEVIKENFENYRSINGAPPMNHISPKQEETSSLINNVSGVLETKQAIDMYERCKDVQPAYSSINDGECTGRGKAWKDSGCDSRSPIERKKSPLPVKKNKKKEQKSTSPGKKNIWSWSLENEKKNSSNKPSEIKVTNDNKDDAIFSKVLDLVEQHKKATVAKEKKYDEKKGEVRDGKPIKDRNATYVQGKKKDAERPSTVSTSNKGSDGRYNKVSATDGSGNKVGTEVIEIETTKRKGTRLADHESIKLTLEGRQKEASVVPEDEKTVKSNNRRPVQFIIQGKKKGSVSNNDEEAEPETNTENTTEGKMNVIPETMVGNNDVVQTTKMNHSYRYVVVRTVPSKLFSEQEKSDFNDALCELLWKTADNLPDPPAFLNTFRYGGTLVVKAKDSASQLWLISSINKLTIWIGFKLIAVSAERVNPYMAEVVFKGNVKFEVEEIMVRLEKQNRGCLATEWYVTNKIVNEDSTTLYVFVNQKASDFIKNHNYKLFFAIGTANVKIYDGDEPPPDIDNF